MRVAVTGVTGFIGGAIARRLLADGIEVLGLGRREDPAPWTGKYARWDLASPMPPPVETLDALRACDAVVHAAAHVATWGPDAPFVRVTVDGTARLLDALDAVEPRLVVIGSSSVYDPRAAHDARHPAREPEGPVPDDRYLGAYALAKAAQERLVLRRRPDAIVLRPRAVWGPGDRTLLPRLLARVHLGRLPLPAGGRLPASHTHVDSLCDAVVAALEQPAVAGPVNVADATPSSPAALVTALGAARGAPITVIPVPAALAEGAAAAIQAVYLASGTRREPPLTRYAVAAFVRPHVLDLARLHGELGIAPDRDLSRGAAAVAAWLHSEARTTDA